MPAGAILDPIERSAATVGAQPRPSRAFSDATVYQHLSFAFHPPPQVVVHVIQQGGRGLVSGLEVIGAARASVEGWHRLETILLRINELLSAHPEETDPTNLAIVERALPLMAAAISEAEVDAEVFPLADGGLMFRWQTQLGSVEVEFDSEGDAVVMIDDPVRATRRAGYLSELWPASLRWLRQA
jgi:hypothetical protein